MAACWRTAVAATGLAVWMVTPAAIAAEPLVPGFDPPPKRAAPQFQEAFMRAEAESPSVERMKMALGRKDLAHAVTTFLPRYLTPGLGPAADSWLDHKDPAVQAAAISGMISRWDDSPASRSRVAKCLTSANAAVRGRAAEYFCWMGVPDDYRPLVKAASAEKDRHTLAAMTEAAAAIKRRHSVFPAGASTGPVPADTGDAAAFYQALAAWLEGNPVAGNRLTVVHAIRKSESFEPVTRYASRLDHGARGDALIRLHRLLAGYPADCAPDVGEALLDQPPVCGSLIPPVRDYFDTNRKSWGILIDGATDVPFAGKRHVGDDAAWLRDQETVVAIGPGIVRRAETGVKSWGGIVIVEHTDRRGGRFCSLYGHLGPLICVKPGQSVTQGQKLGAVGISLTHANGGYMSHLHFGIHRSAWMLPDHAGAKCLLPGGPGQDREAVIVSVDDLTAEARLADGGTVRIQRHSDWPCGYLKPAEFESPANRWTDPQKFIREY